MAKNKMENLRDHCFAALERLNDETLSDDQIKNEIERAEAIAAVAQVLVNSAKVETDFIKAVGGHKSDFINPDKKLNA